MKMEILKAINQLLGKVEAFLLTYSIIAMAVLLGYNSISRTIFNNSFSSAEEFGKILLMIITFIGASNVARFGKHIVMNILFDNLCFKKKKILILITSGFNCVFLSYITYLTIRYVSRVYFFGRILPSLNIPIWTVYSIMPLGLFLTSLQYFFNFIINITYRNSIYLGTENILRNRKR